MEKPTAQGPNVSHGVNLKEIFTEDEIAKLLSDDLLVQPTTSKFVAKGQNKRSNRASKSPSSTRTSRLNSIIFSRAKLILRILELTKQQLTLCKNNILVKGITWLTNELSESLLFKSDDFTMKKIDSLKNEDKDMKYIVSWLEEYSTIKLNSIAKEEFNQPQPHHSAHESGLLSLDGARSKSAEKKGRISFTRKKSITKEKFPSDQFINVNLAANGKKISVSPFLNFQDSIMKNFDNPNFNIFKLDEAVGPENTLSLISIYIFNMYDFYSLIDYTIFENFLQGITSGYFRTNPYHNDLHAADITHSSMIYLKYGGIDKVAGFDIYNLCALFLSCIVHDFRHPGVSNSFLVNTNDPLALRYNDQSVLENFHIGQAFKLIQSKKKYNIFSQLGREEYILIRKRMINCVLTTDMINHAKLYSFIKVSIEKFNISKGSNVPKIFEGLDKVKLYETHQMFLDLVIHSSDISNPTKPYEIYDIWAHKVMTEFYQQGDKEKALGLPVSFLCDRETTTVAQGQIGFMDGVVLPFFTCVVEMFPNLQFLVDNIKENKARYKKIKEKEEAEKK